MKAAKIVLAFAVVLWAVYITWEVFLIRVEVREACSTTMEIETRLALGKPPGTGSDIRYQCP